MEELKRIQKLENLNMVFVTDEEHPVNKGHHKYKIFVNGGKTVEINFQNGARKEKDSKNGVLDTDLLEIVRHRFQSFQKGQFANEETAMALSAVENALKWLNKRVEDRISRQVLGKNEK